jgi:hypothetical protein
MRSPRGVHRIIDYKIYSILLWLGWHDAGPYKAQWVMIKELRSFWFPDFYDALDVTKSKSKGGTTP